ncbi:deoxyribose-phosphate aldolase [Candidatus Peregrinibacteria bacterium]|nr:deoxyribose-phosphate aldolase [Candidatus Peregrinibacteria bacterium]
MSPLEQPQTDSSKITAEDVMNIVIEHAEKAKIPANELDVRGHRFETQIVLLNPVRLSLPAEVAKLAKMIDHTYLTMTPDDPLADLEKVITLCREAGQYGFTSVCVRPNHVALASRLLKYWQINDVAVCAVIDFPEKKGDIAGAKSPDEKSAEAAIAQLNGATEFDVVLDYQAVLREDSECARQGVYAVCNHVKDRDPRAIVKVIMETALLQNWGGGIAVSNACDATIDGGADFGKTSTGFALEGGATVMDVYHLSELLHPCGVQVKASGGIRGLKTVELMRHAGPEDHGADRLGLSSSLAIIKEKMEQIGKV